MYWLLIKLEFSFFVLNKYVFDNIIYCLVVVNVFGILYVNNGFEIRII